MQVVSSFAVTREFVAAVGDRPIFVTAPPGDSTRLFIVEQEGVVRILMLEDNTLLPVPFLDIDPLVINTGNERGLLGLAFHPDYANNGYFYVNYNDNFGDTQISRFSVSTTNLDSADENSQFILLSIDQPFSNHNGGMIEFGPNDGYLYIGMGDGGNGDDPLNLSQNDLFLLGKMLRIDVDNTDPGRNYAIPPSNPYHGGTNPRPEIWSKGWRNPWRWSFDRLTAEMWVADVGQDAREEIDVIPADNLGGDNFGWRCREGSWCTNNSCSLGCPSPDFTDPVHELFHAGVSPCRSITGGYVYRGCAIPELYGRYLFADYCTGGIWSLGWDGVQVTDTIDHSAELLFPFFAIASFGEDAAGELYVCSFGDDLIYKIIPDTVLDCNENGIGDGCDILNGESTDVNENGIPDECECLLPAVNDLALNYNGATIELGWEPVGDGSETYSIFQSAESNALYPGPAWSVVTVNLASSFPDAMTYTDVDAPGGAELRFYLVVANCTN
jgi:glucose/arabinose dehydrogenase